MKFEVGIKQCTRTEYESVEALNASTIKIAHEKSLQHAIEALRHPTRQTDAQQEGSALHCMILEPDKFEERYASMPVKPNGDRMNRRSKLGEDAWTLYEEEHPNQIPLKPELIAKIKGVKDVVRSHPTLEKLLDNALYMECSFFWLHPEYGFQCKGQFDLLTVYEGWTWMMDLKSCVDASPIAFDTFVAKWSLMVQDHWYLEGLRVIAEADRRFGFFMLEKAAPHAIGIYELDMVNKFEGKYRCEAVAKKWAAALDSGVFEGYSNEIKESNHKPWAMTHEREDAYDG